MQMHTIRKRSDKFPPVSSGCRQADIAELARHHEGDGQPGQDSAHSGQVIVDGLAVPSCTLPPAAFSSAA